MEFKIKNNMCNEQIRGEEIKARRQLVEGRVELLMRQTGRWVDRYLDRQIKAVEIREVDIYRETERRPIT